MVLLPECITAGPPTEQVPLCSGGNFPLPGLGEPLQPLAPQETFSTPLSRLDVSTSSTPPLGTPTRSRKRKEQPTPVQKAILERLERPYRDREKENEEVIFGRMVAGMLMKLPEHKRMNAKYEINHMLV